MLSKLARLIFPLCLALGVFTGLWFIAAYRALKAEDSGAALAQPDVNITVDEVIGAGFTRPVQVTNAGDGSQRLFVVEQTGHIRIIQDSTVLGNPFLDISGLIMCCSERGLLGLAFHPDYQNNGHFYVNYTRSGDGATVVARYSVSSDPNVADPLSASTLLTVSQPYANHNGGQVEFGPDGYLYIGMGDGGSGGDPLNHGQNKDSLLGAMLRIDVDASAPYAIPPDNPYAGDSPGADEIWAIGLRNPWRFSFDRETGDLYIGDVGQNLWEEISYQSADSPGGLNFGWRCREGSHTFTSAPPCNDPTYLAGLEDPIAEYSHSDGRSVTGGFVYRGSLYPALVGRYFYADYVEGRIWSLYKTGSNPDSWSTPELQLDTGLTISAFGEDEKGELYVVGHADGTVRRLADVRGPSPNLTSSTKIASSLSVDPDEVVTYTITLNNTGAPSHETLWLTDTVPTGLSYVPSSLTATQGTVNESQDPVLRWQGSLTPTQQITITYRVTATGVVRGSIINQAQLASAAISPITLTNAIFVPRSVLTTTRNDFFLPGTQPGQLLAEIPNPIDCDICHTLPIYDVWRGSMMSQAGRDPVMWAALSIANSEALGAGDYCLRCHTPKGWLEGRSHPADGSALQADDRDAGVACEVCHRMVDPIPSVSDEAKTIDAGVRASLTTTVPIGNPGSAMMIVDPQDNRRGPFSLGPTFSYHTAFRTDFLGQSTDPVTASRLCGTCHNVDNPALSWDEARDQFWPNGNDLAAPSYDEGQLFPIETTFDEWLNSEYAATGVFAPQFAGDKPDGVVASCQDCHMRRTIGRAAEDAFNPFERDCVSTGCLPQHDFAGANTWVPGILQDTRWRLHSPASEAGDLNAAIIRARHMLAKAATLTVTVVTSGTDKVAIVRVTNQTGHKLPTGYPEGRHLWINVKAYDDSGDPVYESGAYDQVTGTLAQDPELKIYEAKQGITLELGAVLNLPAGESFHFVLNNKVIKDNRIPPRGFTQSAFNKPGLRPVGATYVDGQYWDETLYTLPLETEQVLATLYYQTSSQEYIDFLRANGGVDGQTLGSLWDDSKSPPEVMATAFFPSRPYYLPIITRNVSAGGDNQRSDRR